MVDFIVSTHHRRRGQLPHPQRRHPAPVRHAQRRGHDPRGPVDLQALRRDRREVHRLPGDQHLPTSSVPPQGSHHRHRRLGLRAPGRVLWVVEIRAPNKEAGITDCQSGSTGTRPPGRGRDREAAPVERRAVRGKAHVDWKPFHHPSSARSRSAAGTGSTTGATCRRTCARARRRASVVDDPDRARCPGSSCCAPKCARSAPTPGRVRLAVANSGWLPACHQQARARAVVRGVMFEIHLPEGRPTVTLVSGPAAHGRSAARGPRARSLHAFVQGREVTADRAVAEWVVARLRATARVERARRLRGRRAHRGQPGLTVDAGRARARASAPRPA